MSYHGWMTLGGQEIINNSRVAAYARHLVPALAPRCDDCGETALALGDGEYTFPALDEAPWFDAQNADSQNFAGFYALSVTGLDDDSRQASVIEGSFNGGSIGRVRRGVKEIRVTGLLLGADDCALDYGMGWLKHVLDGNACPDPANGCNADDLCFFSCCPTIVPGSVDPSADPVVHDLALDTGWDTTQGYWVNGRWRVPQVPAEADGPVLDPPCDDVTYRARIKGGDHHRVRLLVRSAQDSSDIIAESPVVLLRRTNYALNPRFSAHGASSWSSSSGSFQMTDNTGVVTMSSQQPSGTVILSGEGTTAQPDEEFSSRLTVDLSGEGITYQNLAPNPAVRTLNGWDAEATRDTSLFYTDDGSARVVNTEDGADDIGSITYGDTDDEYAIRVTGGQMYAVGSYVNTSIDSTCLVAVSWLSESGTLLGFAASSYHSAAANTWTRVQGDFTAPSGAVRMRVATGAEPASGTASAGDSLNVDAVMVSPGSLLVPYFDGDYPDCRWEGLPHSSPSVWNPTAESACVQLRTTVGATSVLGEQVQMEPDMPVELVTPAASDPAGGDVTVEVVACDTVDNGSKFIVSRGLIESAPTPGPYFDGSTPDDDDYRYRWAGVADRAPSVAEHYSDLVVTAPEGTGPFYPVIEAIEGDEFDVTEVQAVYREEADPEECAEDFVRQLRRVATISGPTVLEDFDTCGGAMRRVEFLLVAAVPWTWHWLRPTFQILPESSGGGGGGGYQFQPAEVAPSFDCPPEDDPLPLNDPDCPLPPAPPKPPAIEECVDQVTVYRRRAVGIPGDLITPTQVAVPVVELQVNTSEAVRQARVRFYPNPLSREQLDDLDNCSFCGEFVITYMPGNSIFRIDGTTESAVSTGGGGSQREASHLLRSSNGGPMVWPLLTCGLPYIMTVDTAPLVADVVTADLQLVVRT